MSGRLCFFVTKDYVVLVYLVGWGRNFIRLVFVYWFRRDCIVYDLVFFLILVGCCLFGILCVTGLIWVKAID